MKNYQKYNKLARIKHKKYPWIRTLRTIKLRCKNPNNPDFKNYGGRGIKCLITEDELRELWFRDEAQNMDQPTIDRIDNDGHYEYNNCRWLENKENSVINKRKNILQYDLNGNFIREWISQSDASRNLNINQGNIGACCRGERSKAGGYIWKFALDKTHANVV